MKILQSQKLVEILRSGANALSNNRDRINALNVFPVPDGDTGSNMCATINYAVDQIINLETTSVAEISRKFARGALMGARGNSGVILSQVFKGFSLALEGREEASVFDLVNAFKAASKAAYEAVMKPVEGTILTVIRETAEQLTKTITPANTITELFEIATKFARISCENTPNLLPILKEVGVVDSGGEGLVIILQGMHSALLGKFIEVKNVQVEASSFIMGEEEDYGNEFGYCTEFIVSLKNPKSFSKDKFVKTLADRHGTSVVVVCDDDILKSHIHTLKPGAVFSFAQKYGEFIKLKSENMTLQANESQATRKEKAGVFKKLSNLRTKKNEVAVISCNTGSGIVNEMYELGTTYIIEAGQTSNPSAADFIKAIEKIKSDSIIILPNNSNIILVAQQVAQTVIDKKLIIIPTKNQAQGLVAMINYSPHNNLEENHTHMEEGANSVKVGQVTTAIRDTKINGIKIKKDEIIGIVSGKILFADSSKIEVSCKILRKLVDDESELITIYYGDTATEVDAKEIKAFVDANFEDVSVEIKSGNQPIYSFLISVE